VKRIVIDAVALLTWFDGTGPHRSLRADYEAGALTVLAPRHLVADVLGELAARDEPAPDRLARIAGELQRLGVQLQDPPVAELAGWLAQGLDPRRAAYAALAASLDVPLAAADADLRRVAADLLLRG
jgi:predicted nucleic acid-binding protein